MSGTKVGGKKAADTNKKKYGEQFYAEIGKKGGQNGSNIGWWTPERREEASRVGKLGGRPPKINP